jgi:hypothetical protein
MSKDETMSTSSTGAKKAENDERYDLIPAEPLRMLARHYGVGAKKYDDRNWEAGYEWHKSFAAMMRHAWQFWNGEDIDPETGSPHTVAVMWHAAALTEYLRTHPEFDDRPKASIVTGTPLIVTGTPLSTDANDKLAQIQAVVNGVGGLRLPYHVGMEGLADAVQRILDA